MSETELDTQLSRRQFLAGCGAVSASAALTSAPAAAGGVQNDVFGRLPSTGLGQVSLKGKGEIAKVDRQLAQQHDPIGQTLDAITDLGLDPSAPINETLPDAVSDLSNVRIEFPKNAVFRANGRILLDPAGPIELIGHGTTIQMETGTHAFGFNCPELPSGTLIQGFTVDMTAPDTRTGIRVGTDGVVELRDVTVRGYAPPISSDTTGEVMAVLMPIARSSDATVRMTNFRATGGTAAGIHDDMGKPASAPENRLDGMMGLWVGQANLGTIQMVGCKMRGWSNGTYSGRTKGRVQILGGTFWNNFNCQARIGGGSIIDGTTMLLDGRMWSMKENPGPYSLGENQGVHAIRIETGGDKGVQDEPATLRNLDIRGISMETSSSLINIEGSGPSTLIENCRITNHIGVPSILAAAPGSQGSYSAAPTTNIMVQHCLIDGKTTKIAEVTDRPQSRIQKTCISVPGAGPDGINGMEIGPGVGFGKQCKYGLKNPKKVGDGNPPGKLPIPDNPGGPGGPDNPGREGPSKGVIVAVIDGIFMFLLLLFGMVVLFVAGILGALGAFAAMIGSD